MVANSPRLAKWGRSSSGEPNGSRTSAAVYMHENKLYIIEGTVPDGYPEPGFFQQSVGWIDENGRGIRYQQVYHHGWFPKPPVSR